jgi:hypothetical protein
MREARLPTGFIAGFLAAAALWLALFCAALGQPTSTSRWIHELIERKEDLARQMPGPRLIVGGGSGALYGVRARELARELGIPVLNAGLHAGLGLEYILHEVTRLARPGDTVLLALEYDLYTRRDDDDVLLDYLVSRDPGYFRVLPPQRQLRAFLRLPVQRLANPFLVRVFASPPPYPVYLDAYGDTLSNNTAFKTAALRANVAVEPPLRLRQPTAAAIDRLRDFSAWARENRVRLLATHPNTIRFPEYFERPQLRRDLSEVTALHATLGIPFVDAWNDTMWDARWFFDTIYHLDNVGATMRSRDLAGRLRRYVDGASWGSYLPPRGTHGLETVDARFWRFEPLTGFGTMNDVGTPAAEPYIEALAPRSEIMVRTLHASRAHLTTRLRSRGGTQELRLVADTGQVTTWSVARDFQRFDADVELAAGDNRLSLIKASATPVDIAEWRVQVPGDGPAAAPYPD